MVDRLNVVMIGATGLVGGALLARLSRHQVTVVGRRVVDGVTDQHVAPVADWPAIVERLRPDIAISTLGTTINAAGSQAAFAAVDFDAVVGFARAAKHAGARQFLMVSSVGAGGASFYLSTKGRVEVAVRALGFMRTDIFRPGLLIGNRAGRARPVEQFFSALSPLTNALTPRSLDRYRAIAAEDVATAMAQAIGAATGGVFIHHNRDMLLSIRR